MDKEDGSEGFLETKGVVRRAEQELEEAIKAERPEDLAPKEEENSEETSEEVKESKVPENVPGDEDADGHDWKTRYGNLRRYMQKELDRRDGITKEKNDEITSLKGQLEQTAKSTNVSLPETDEDLEQLKTENPGAYNSIIKIAKSIADDVVEDKMAALRTDVDAINNRSKKNVEDAAEVALQKRHPKLDIANLGTDTKFMEWFGTLSKKHQADLTENKEDVESASFVLRAYEREVLEADPKSKKDALVKDVNREASRDVKTSGAKNPSDAQPDKGYDFLESEIERMPPKVFEEKADDIEKAYRNGRVLMDKSGASSN